MFNALPACFGLIDFHAEPILWFDILFKKFVKFKATKKHY